MSVSLGIWHITLEGGTEKTIQTPAQIQITNISFGEEILDNNGRSVVKLQLEKISPDSDDEDEDEDEEEAEPKLDTTILCALTPGKIEQTTVNLVLDLESEYTFSVSGKNTVHLTGNYIRQLDEPPSDDENEFFSDEDNEDGYDLREVSSDVEIYPDDLDSDAETDASRFEEVEEEAPKASKRARESDATEKEAEAPSKKNKKLKAEGGKAVTAPETQVPDKKERKKEKKESKAEGEAKKNDETKDKKKTLSGGVVIQDAKVGTGPMAKKGNRVSMRYIGKLTNGTQFDANTKGTPFSFNLGKGEVIKGWDEGIVGMQVGGERILTIPPKMGYGSTKQGKIPSNSTLVFDVKLLSIK